MWLPYLCKNGEQILLGTAVLPESLGAAIKRIRWWRRLRDDLDLIERHVQPAKDDIGARLNAVEITTIALEDRRFFNHPGVDIGSVIREAVKALTFRRHGGASTIDMQFVRTATGYRRHTLGRKFYEALLALLIQYRFEKIVILRSYLACAYFGTGLKGADAAARRVFDKDANQLRLEEASMISAMLACPRPLSGSASWELRARRRAAYGLQVFTAGGRRLAGRFQYIQEN